MSIIRRQIVIGILVSVLLFAVVSAMILLAFPLDDWSKLWKTKLIDVPVIVLLPASSIIFGFIVGISLGLYWRSKLNSIDHYLFEIDQGNPIHIQKFEHSDLYPIYLKMEQIQKQLKEQTVTAQRLSNEKAVDIEQRLQELVSEERNRLARELHDSVSQQLFAASMLLSAINERVTDDDKPETKQLKLVQEMVHQSQLEMRALLLHLRPVALKGKSLQKGMEEFLIEMQGKVPLEITWKIEDMSLDKGVEDHLFRILQESVSNTLRHAKANHLDILLIERDQFVILRVVDDGIGFDMDQSKTGSYGLQNMHERAKEIGGSLKIVSLPSMGTRLEVKVPKLSLEGGQND